MAILPGGFLVTFLLVGRRFSIDEAVVERRIPWIVASTTSRLCDCLCSQRDINYAAEFSFEDGLSRTTKGDERYHGFGTRSIRRFVDDLAAT